MKTAKQIIFERIEDLNNENMGILDFIKSDKAKANSIIADAERLNKNQIRINELQAVLNSLPHDQA